MINIKRSFKFKNILEILYLLTFCFFDLIIAIKILETDSISIFKKLLLIIVIVIISVLLFYLSYYDYKRYEIPLEITIGLLATLFILNILFVIILGTRGNLLLWKGNDYAPLENLFSAIISMFFIFFIVLITKFKGMGLGDIFVAGIMGLILGLDNLVPGFYATVISASIIGLLYAYKNKKLKGLKLPLVPFIVFGIFFAFTFSVEIRNFIEIFYWI